MTDIWLLSDHHFNHSRMLTFTGPDGELIRPGFKNIDHFNEYVLEKHNSVVKPGNKVYFGGDLGRDFDSLLKRMNGRKRLILGNHETLGIKQFKYFEKILSWRFFGHLSKKFIVCHYPLHPSSFVYRGNRRPHGTKLPRLGEYDDPYCYCVHGHTHQQLVKFSNGQIDTRYFNICCEYLDYTPIHIEDLISRLGKPQVERNKAL